MYEVLLAIMAEKKLRVLVPPREKRELAATLADDIDKVQRAVSSIRVEHAEATMESDRE